MTIRFEPPTGALMSAMLPQTLYRSHVVACDDPANAYTFTFMSDYLSMMDILTKAISRELAAACDMTPLQYRILLRLLVSAERSTNLAQQLDVSISTISSAIAKLADAGLVQRHENETDMRTVQLRLTNSGRSALERADACMLKTMTSYWRSLTQEQLEAALHSSIEAVTRHSHPRIEKGKQRLDTALIDTVMISRTLTSRALHDRGMTTNDFRILLALRILESSTTTRVADFLFLNSSDLTSCLKHLESHQLISRDRAPDNRRTRILELTERGKRRLIELMPIVFDALHETCHSDDELIRIHISAANDLIARKRAQKDEF